MNKQTRMTIAYAQDAMSFLFLDEGIRDHIRGIYLFGSGARGELTKESDIDIFVDCVSEHEPLLNGIIKSAISRYYQSKDFDKWKILRFTHPISIQAGDLETWQIKTSIMVDGILLYSRTIQITPANRNILITFTLPKEKTRYLRFIRAMFGRKEKGYKDKGALGDAGGTRIGANIIIVPSENLQQARDILHKHKTQYSMKEIALLS